MPGRVGDAGHPERAQGCETGKSETGQAPPTTRYAGGCSPSVAVSVLPRPAKTWSALQGDARPRRGARPSTTPLRPLTVPDRATAPEEDWKQRPAEPSTPLSLENGTVASPASLADAKERRSLRPSAGSIPQETQDSAEDRRSMLFRHDRERK